MGTVITICVSVVLVATLICFIFYMNTYCVKKAEFTHKENLEKLRLKKADEDDKKKLKEIIIAEIIEEKTDFKDNLSKSIEKEIKNAISSILEPTIIDRIKTIEEQLKIWHC